MCELLGFSARHPTRLTLSLKRLAEHGGHTGPHDDGWGYAFYAGREAQLVKASHAAADSNVLNFIIEQQFSAAMAIAHIRKATQGTLCLANTHPFMRELHGRRWLFAHNGQLEGLPQPQRSLPFQPIGETDSEQAFCLLLQELWSHADYFHWPLPRRMSFFSKWLHKLRGLGPANILFSDSEYLFAHAHKRRQKDGEIKPPGLWVLQRECDEPSAVEGFVIENDTQSVTLVASVPLTEEDWVPLAEGDLIAVREGKIHARMPAS